METEEKNEGRAMATPVDGSNGDPSAYKALRSSTKPEGPYDDGGDDGSAPSKCCCLASTRSARAWTLVIGCLNIVAAGSILAFNSYAIDLKITFAITQTQLEVLAGVMTTCASLGYPVGLFYERFGHTVTLVVSVVTGSGSLLLLYSATYSRVFYNDNFWLLAIYYGLYGFSTVPMYLISMTANMKNFPHRHRGLIVGVTGASWWLGPAIIAAIYNNALAGQELAVRPLFLMLACIFITTNILSILFIKDLPPAKGSDTDFPQLVPDSDTAESLFDRTGLNLLKSVEFHLLTWGYLLAGTVQQMFIPNVSTFASQLRLNPQGKLLTMIGPLFASAMKLLSGIVSDWTAKCGLPRTTYPLVGTVLQATVFFVCVFAGVNEAAFVATTVIIYCNNGIFWTIVPTLMSEFFGMAHFSRNWGMEILAASILTWIFMVTFGVFYDKRMEYHFNPCESTDCFIGIFIICSCVTTVALFFFLVLFRHESEHRQRQDHETIPILQ